MGQNPRGHSYAKALFRSQSSRRRRDRAARRPARRGGGAGGRGLRPDARPAADWRDANEIGRFINRFRFLGDPVTVGYASGRTVFKYSSEPVGPPLVAAARATSLLPTNEPQESPGPGEIVFEVPRGAKQLSVDIWDRFAGYVRKLKQEAAPRPGSHTLTWDLKDESGNVVAPGAYIYRLTIDDEAESRLAFVTG